MVAAWNVTAGETGRGRRVSAHGVPIKEVREIRVTATDLND